MSKTKMFLRKSSALTLSALLAMSAAAAAVPLQVQAVSYSEMSALDSYQYTGNDLGAVYTKNSTTFKVWAPTASKVQLKRYKTGSDTETGAGSLGVVDMTKQESQGLWSTTVSGDLAGTYYTYLVTVNGSTKETVDIYARTTGVNGKRGMVIDLDSTDPVGWETDHRISCPNQTDAIIWEAHVRDFSASSDSGMTNKGKYLAFTETGTTVNNDGVHKTGIDYLEDLGVTHVHLLPVYDYASVDETALNTDQFNWGYDPMNYNTPEGSYSTDPYHGEVRVREFKQMVQALHKKKIGVVMDVVYNHTYAGGSGQNDWFDFTVPGYYYRQTSTGAYSNGSGCGNETASDRAMYRKFMIDSLKYWATEYHLDGFRFDLMGIHDVETMNLIRQAMDEIDPNIILYGEPWTAEASPCPTPTAVQSNMGLVSERVAAFNDKVRDAIKGSCFNQYDSGFIQGAGYEEDLKTGIQANTTVTSYNKWSKQPSQTVTYTSAHDNFTLYDKLVASVKGGSGYNNRYEDLVAMNKMAAGIILTSQGMSFFQAGEEFARSKYGDHNSYKSSTSINQLVWNNTITYGDLKDYYKGLIEIRKAYSPFRDPTNTSNQTIYFSWGTNFPSNVVAFTMYNKLKTSGEWNFVGVIHNANSTAQTVTLRTHDTVTLPSQWVIIANGSSAGVTSLGTTGSTVTVPARSTMILVDKTSFDNTVIATDCTVTVNHISKSDNKLLATETLTGKEGVAYETSPKASLLQSGYTVSSVTGPTTGTFSKEGAVVNYYYELDLTRYGTVTVQYVRADTGAELAPSEVYTGLIGSSYSFSPKAIDGYECDTTLTANASGTYSSTPITVVFKYVEEEQTGLTVHYYNTSWSTVNMYVYKDEDTEYTGVWPGSPMTSEGGGWWKGTVPNVQSALFIANNGSGTQEPSGYMVPGYSVSGECWIRNQTVYPTGKVIVNYMTTTGTLLLRETKKGMADGSNAYVTEAKTFDGYTLTQTPSNASGLYTKATITVNYLYEKINTDPLVNSSTVSKSLITIGSSVTMNGQASGGTAPYTYAYYYRTSANTPWQTIDPNEYTSSTSVTFTPSFVNDYQLLIRVKDSTGEVAEKTFTLTVQPADPDPLTNTSTVSTTNPQVGQIVTLTGKASGGTTPYKYAFYYKKSTSSGYTTIGTAYGSATTATFTPGAVATYNIKIVVKDSTGKTAAKTVNITSVKKDDTPLTNTSTVSAKTVEKGTSVTLHGKATGGTSPYRFTYQYKKATSKTWTTLKEADTTSAYAAFTPGMVAKYNVRITVKDQNGSTATRNYDVTSTDPAAALTNTSKLSASTGVKGKAVTITGSATGGTSPYKFAYYYKKSTSSGWTTIKDFSSATTAAFTPGAAATYNVKVVVKDNTGKTAERELSYQATAGAALSNTSTLSTTTPKVGQTITISGKATGGTAPYTYAYYYKKSSKTSWIVIDEEFTSSAAATVVLGSAVDYDIMVIVKDAAGQTAKKTFTVTASKA